MEVTPLLIALQIAGAAQPNAVAQQILGKFSSMKACEEAAKGSEFQSSDRISPSAPAKAQFMCIQTK
jgi:hypothetical protein